MFCGIQPEQIITALNAESLYDIPLLLEKEGLTRIALRLLHCRQVKPDLRRLREVAKRARIIGPVVRIGLVGKYTDLSDSYLSVIEAAKHAGFATKSQVVIVPVDSEHLDMSLLKTVDAIIVPGGFGTRGVEGKIKAIQWARENGIPFLGICLGLQCAVIEIARHVAGLKDATSEEFNEKTPHPVIAFLPEQKGLTRKGGTMRLGAYLAALDKTSFISRLYSWGEDSSALDFPSLSTIESLKPTVKVSERHRHRYEVNPAYHSQLKQAGIQFAGMSPDGLLVEFIELPRSVHPYFVATQAHPEFKSRPGKAHPLFAGLVQAALEQHSPLVVVAPKAQAIAKNT